ncbi:MAG: NAD(P)H-hydrate epimerase, partial [Chloroflexi bacterium]|nr:NAD(P)H-hydrate epimerase [Chloroflexota bacterium]
MSRVVTVAQMRAIEKAADAAGLSYARMMENAGRAVAEIVLQRTHVGEGARAAVLCGPGNNGGDGLVAAHYLAEAGVQAACYLTRMRPDDDPLVARLRAKGLLVADAENDQRGRVLANLLGGADILIDAVLGTGIELPVRGAAGELLSRAGKLIAGRERPPLVVAVDCPSGVDCDSGAVDALTLPAGLTVTMAAAKIGLFRFPAANFTGEVAVADIGVPDDLPEVQALRLELARPQAVAAWLPPRPRDAHKGTFGRALICAGSVNYTGAAYLAGAAAYRVGAGLVTLAVPAAIYPILAAQLPEATWVALPQDMGVIAAPAAEVLGRELDSSQSL